jgi:hypothetical protein
VTTGSFQCSATTGRCLLSACRESANSASFGFGGRPVGRGFSRMTVLFLAIFAPFTVRPAHYVFQKPSGIEFVKFATVSILWIPKRLTKIPTIGMVLELGKTGVSALQSTSGVAPRSSGDLPVPSLQERIPSGCGS